LQHKVKLMRHTCLLLRILSKELFLMLDHSAMMESYKCALLTSHNNKTQM
jgi:hypothetical protein